MVNSFSVSGNLGRDSELRTTQNNNKVLNFSIANTTGFGDHEKTNWIKCSLFGDKAEKLHQHFVKGTNLFVVGEFTTSKWKDKDGNERESWEMFVKDFSFGGKKSGGDAGASPGNSHSQADPFEDDMVPF